MILNNQFVRNLSASADRTQPAEGGAIKVNEGTPIIANNLFRQNVVTNAGSTGEARGAAIATLLKGNPQIVNNTLLQNTATVVNGATAPDQGSIYIGNTNTPALVGNNLVAYNSSGVYAPGRAPDLKNNLVFANIRTNYERIPDPTGTAGNISVSPKLTGPYGDPHLQSGSPAINAGDVTLVQSSWTDLDDLPRISEDRVDIGADEFDGTTYTIPDRIFYVRVDGDDSKDGRSWENARKTVSSALLDAGADGGEVWVKAGTYTNRFRAEVFTYVYGGFNGTETRRADRNWASNITVLDGNISTTPGTVVVGPAVISVYGLDGYGALSGFTVMNGAGRQGGGVFAHGSPQISDNIFRNNAVLNASGFIASGAGIFSQGGAPLILNNLFVGNTAPATTGQNGRGGGIYLDSPAGALPLVINNTFLNNFATNGGAAIYLNTNAAARIVNNLIAFNASGVSAASAAQAAQISVLNNCVYGNTTNELVNVALGTGNVTVDPRLVNPSAGNYRLRADSPCLDAADATVVQSAYDIYGQPRVAQQSLDIGAAEFTGPLQADFDVILTQPVSGAALFAPATFPVSANVTGGTDTPAYVEFTANGRVIAVATSSPFTSFANGLLYDNYEILARAVTASGSVRTSTPVSISVLLPPGNLPPTVAFTSPTNTQSFQVDGPTTVKTTIAFSKPGGRIIGWTLLSGETKLAENQNVATGTTSATVNIPNLGFGSYTFTAIVLSSVGDRATNSVTFGVAQRAPVTAPVLLVPVLQPDGTIKVEMTVPTLGAQYRLETSTNLVNWTLVTLANGAAANLVTNLPGTNVLGHFRGSGAYP